MKNLSEVARKYKQRYSQHVMVDDQTLEKYNRFLLSMGEFTPLEKLVEMQMRERDPCRILDIGCGSGNALHELKKTYGPRVHTYGIDLVPPKHKLDTFLWGNVHAIDLPHNCGLIISFRALHEMDGLHYLLPHVARALAVNGRAYLWVRVRDVHGNHAPFAGEMNPDEERYLFQLASQRELGHVRVLAQPIYEPISPASEEDTPLSVVAGFSVVMLNPRA